MGRSRVMSPSRRRARIAAGVILLSGIALFATGVLVSLAGGRPAPSDVPTAPFWSWLIVAAGAVAGWYTLWQRALETPAGGLVRLVVGWTLLDAQLLVALLSAILGGTPMLLVPAFTILALGLLLSFPRRGEPMPPAGDRT